MEMELFEVTKRTCPVCRRLVYPTRGDCPVVIKHRDKAGNPCQMSGEPYYLTEPYCPQTSTWSRSA